MLLLADRRKSHTQNALRTGGYHILLSFTPDHTVALCVNQDVDVVVLDQEHFIVTDDWSVAQSIKMIKPRICVFLIARGKIVGNKMPIGIDAIITEGDTQGLLAKLKELL